MIQWDTSHNIRIYWNILVPSDAPRQLVIKQFVFIFCFVFWMGGVGDVNVIPCMLRDTQGLGGGDVNAIVSMGTAWPGLDIYV